MCTPMTQQPHSEACITPGKCMFMPVRSHACNKEKRIRLEIGALYVIEMEIYGQ